MTDTSDSKGRRKRTVASVDHSGIKRPCSGLVGGRIGERGENPITKDTETISISRDNDHENTTNHSFPTNALDHCETPRAAYQHLQKFLLAFGGDSSKNLTIWDPFYCNGTMQALFTEMGFSNVIHDNVDFYQLIQQQKIPEHNVLVTNPPYSDDHIPRLLQFVVEVEIPKRIPCCLLLPNWVSRQADYVSKFVEPVKRAHHELFYLSPLEAYTYTMPTWVPDRPSHVGSSGLTTPYLSSWYIVVPSKNDNGDGKSTNSSFLQRMDAVSKQQQPPAWVVAQTVKGLKWKMKNHLQRKSKEGRRGRK